MLIVEAFLAKEYKNVLKEYRKWCEVCQIEHIYEYPELNYKTFDVNIPALFPLKGMDDSKNTQSIPNIYLNKMDVSNVVSNQNHISVPAPKGVLLPMTLPKGFRFLLISPDGNPLNGTLILP